MHVLVLNGQVGDDNVFVSHGDDDVYGDDAAEIDSDDAPCIKQCSYSRPPGGKLVTLVAVFHGRRPTLGTRSAW